MSNNINSSIEIYQEQIKPVKVTFLSIVLGVFLVFVLAIASIICEMIDFIVLFFTKIFRMDKKVVITMKKGSKGGKKGC